METCRIFCLKPAAGTAFTIADQTVSRDRLAAALAELFNVPQHPECERLAAGIESPTLLIPLLNQTERRNPAARLESVRPYPVAPGISILAAAAPESAVHRRGYAEILLAAANGFVSQSGSAALPDLIFRYEQPGTCLSDLSPLLDLYGLPKPAFDPLRPFTAAIEVSIPGADLAVWYLSPRQRTTAFYEAFTAVSTAVQRALRHWLRFAWFGDLARFENLATSRALMMYWLSLPHRSDSRSEFSSDVLSPAQLNRLYARSTAKANRELRQIRSRLTAAGRDPSAAAYNPLRRAKVVAAVRREGRPLNRLFAVESNLVDTLTGFSAEARLVPSSDQVSPFELATRYVHALRVHLRRQPLPEWSHDLALLVLIHATTALRTELGLPAGLRARLTLPVEVDSRENLPSPLPLAS